MCFIFLTFPDQKITISHVRMLNIEAKICLDQYIYEVTEKSSKLPSLSTMVQVLISIVQSQSLELLAKLELVVFSCFDES